MFPSTTKASLYLSKDPLPLVTTSGSVTDWIVGREQLSRKPLPDGDSFRKGYPARRVIGDYSARTKRALLLPELVASDTPGPVGSKEGGPPLEVDQYTMNVRKETV